MRLELGNFYVKEICFGEKTSYQNGVLSINKQEALKVVLEDEHVIEADLVIARPGDEIRIVPVKESIEPRSKVKGEFDLPRFN